MTQYGWICNDCGSSTDTDDAQAVDWIKRNHVCGQLIDTNKMLRDLYLVGDHVPDEWTQG